MKRREFITPFGNAASKINATKQKEEITNKDGPETPDSPPIDLWGRRRQEADPGRQVAPDRIQSIQAFRLWKGQPSGRTPGRGVRFPVARPGVSS
jgi:hypothetical protein